MIKDDKILTDFESDQCSNPANNVITRSICKMRRSNLITRGLRRSFQLLAMTKNNAIATVVSLPCNDKTSPLPSPRGRGAGIFSLLPLGEGGRRPDEGAKPNPLLN